MASGTEFETADLDSVINVIGLTPSDPLDTFVEIWYQVFLWALFSSLFVHFVAAVVAFSMLRKQQIGRFSPLLILLMGLVAPLTGGALTNTATTKHSAPVHLLNVGTRTRETRGE
ncbi:transmembrane protein 170A isoform X2 [Dermacentor silvarum]|uniref:transmembrane protein 170A isoform X2 n=1 Tax=Dermacentor silvarum TaxID=543639 RepID=UPI00210113E2|nr:transmembrane protein 170A isoform X2 [Dermacentor silvarum]